jgi:hypothetical protein
MADFDARALALNEELECGVRLVESGLHACRELVPPGDDYYTPLFLLSNGFERLLKAAVCYALLEEFGDYPTAGGWKRKWWQTHSLQALLANLLELADMPDAHGRAVLSRVDDEEAVLCRIWRVLEQQSVADAGRYHTLNVVLSARRLVHKGRLDPAYEWQQIETDLAGRVILAGQVTPDEVGMDRAYSLAASRIADEVGWFAWSIARMFKKWSLGQEAWLFSDVVQPLLAHEPPRRLPSSQ